MINKRILLIGGVSLVKGRIKTAGIAMQEICNVLEPLLKQNKFVENAPFDTVSLIIRFGENENLNVEYERINKQYKELPVAIQLDMESLRFATEEYIKITIMSATLYVLEKISEKYSLPCDFLQKVTNA